MAFPSMITDETKAATKNIQAALALASGSATLRILTPCRLPPVVEAALAEAPASAGALRPHVPAPCPEVTEATKAIFRFPCIQAALDRLAAEEAAKECVGTLVKTAIANVVAQAEARECVAKMVQAAVDSVLAGSASKGPNPDATEVVDIEQASLSDDDVGAEVDALCELLVVECCDDCAEEFLSGVNAGSDGAAAILTSSDNKPYIAIVEPHLFDMQEASTAAVELTLSINNEAVSPADLNTGTTDDCNSKSWLDMPKDWTKAGVPPRRRSLAGQVSDFPLASEADVFSAEMVVPAARHGDSATSHVGAANLQDNTTKQQKKGRAGMKRSKAARQGKKGKHAKKGKKGRA